MQLHQPVLGVRFFLKHSVLICVWQWQSLGDHILSNECKLVTPAGSSSRDTGRLVGRRSHLEAECLFCIITNRGVAQFVLKFVFKQKNVVGRLGACPLGSATSGWLRMLQYCKTLNVCVPFISRAKQNCEIKGREYQLQAKNRTKLLHYLKSYGFHSPK